MHKPTLRLLMYCLLAASCWQGSAVQELSDWYSGILTHYGGKQDRMNPADPSFGTKEGACGYGLLPKDRWPYWSVAALATSSPLYQNSSVNGCGLCFQIQCISGMDDYHKDACYKDSKGVRKSVLVVVTDECPECGPDHIDMQALTFSKMTNPDIGRIKINYRRIECTPPEDMKVSVMDFVAGGRWIRLAVDDTGGRGQVTQVYTKNSNSESWISMVNKWGAAWELGQAPSPPLDFKFETDDGEEVVATGVIKQNGGINQGAFAPRLRFDTGVQFTITDPAAQVVQATAGPDDSIDPMVATSDTPGNDGLLDGLAPAASTSSGLALASSVPPAPTAERLPNITTAVPSAAIGNQCLDIPSPGAYSCAQQKEWGKCAADFMIKNGYCAITCGRCQAAKQLALPPPAAEAFAPAVAIGNAASPPGEACVDIPLPGVFTCAMQKEWERCDADYMLEGDYCAATCGRCASASSAQTTIIADSSTPALVPEKNILLYPTPATEKLAAQVLAPAPTAPETAPSSALPANPAPEAAPCADIVPPGIYSCAQQKAWGKCDVDYILRADYCAVTCGRCQPREPVVQSFSDGEQRAGARRLLDRSLRWPA